MKSGIDGEDDDYGGMLSSSGKRKKISKNNTRTDISFYFKFIIVLLVIEAYFSYNYAMMRVFTDTAHVQVDEFNKTAMIEPFFWFSLNNQREMYYNKSKPILLKDSFNEASWSLYVMYDSTN